MPIYRKLRTSAASHQAEQALEGTRQHLGTLRRMSHLAGLAAGSGRAGADEHGGFPLGSTVIPVEEIEFEHEALNDSADGMRRDYRYWRNRS